MAEDHSDLIEESNDDIENWIYYKNEAKQEEIVNTLTDVDQQLIYINYNLLDANEHKFQNEGYNDHSGIVSADVLVSDSQENCNQILEQAEVTNDNIDDETGHNIILREAIDENGQLVEEYFCNQCNISFDSIDDFLIAHPSAEILNENIEHEITNRSCNSITTVTEDKLWELIEKSEIDDETTTDIKPNVMHQDDSAQEKESSNNTVETEKEHYFCYDCQQVFTDLMAAENHDCNNELETSEIDANIIIDEREAYKCQLCDKFYPSLRSFTNHRRWHKKSENPLGHTKRESAVCEVCNTIFASEKNLKLHMKMHKKQTVKTIQDALPAGAQEEYNDLNQFFCELCNKSFDQNLLGIHKTMHQHLEEYKCGKCNKNFENLPSYEIHMQMHEDNIKKGITTKRENIKSFSQEAPSTSAQGYIGNNKRKHACQYCGKEFQRPYEKVKHERVHTGEKPYECEVCGKTFRVSYSLTLHLRTHTDIRPYICATCNKRFKQQSVYVHHLKTHEAECAYKCDFCGKSFRTAVQLSGHKNIHSKPYNCTECSRPFASLYAVKIHMKTHNKFHKSNKNLKNSCSICGASYARVFALSSHIKEQHGIDVDPMKLAAASADANVSGSHNKFFIRDCITEEVESNEVNNEEYGSQVDHEENVQNNIYMDETEAATQTILNIEEMSVNHFPAEEIITDW